MSELKRFVLFTDKMIYEFNKHSGLYHYDNQKDVCVHGSQINLTLVEKTSDDILDLVEVGDLVEFENNIIYFISNSKAINKFYCGELGWLDFNDNEDIEDIVAIYKRKANGDYKRYEIGGKE